MWFDWRRTLMYLIVSYWLGCGLSIHQCINMIRGYRSVWRVWKVFEKHDNKVMQHLSPTVCDHNFQLTTTWTPADRWHTWTPADRWHTWTPANRWHTWTPADRWHTWTTKVCFPQFSVYNVLLRCVGAERSRAVTLFKWTGSDNIKALRLKVVWRVE